ncbi:hypothetical protein PVAP13_9KG087900 [Panicum virgatum]|uniref:Uncharacterized protein n=1 Tax=Panicum virgatum TaxID=38727 RepID=A0A8T0NVH3_PANVG|nr:hypothetical protein PVAP13_9KG087900 [Panicum virgatum]
MGVGKRRRQERRRKWRSASVVIGFLDIEALALEGCHHPNLDLRLNSLPSSATSSPAYISLALLFEISQ